MHDNKIGTLRKAWALSQDELAQLLGMTRSNLSRLELAAKSYTLDTVLKLVAIFGTSVQNIFPHHDRVAYEDVAGRLAEFSIALEDEEGAVADRKRQLLAEFAGRAGVADIPA